MAKINGSTINHVRVIKPPLDVLCAQDLATGKGIRLASHESFDKKKKNEPIYDGLQSTFWSDDLSTEHAYKERWKCKCGKYIGKAYEGLVCDVCGTRVEYADADLSKTGWIIIDQFEVMSPIFLAKLMEALGTVDGESVLTKILEAEYHDEDEPIQFTDKELTLLKKHPYIKKGAIWLSNRDNFLEVIDYYEKKKPGKVKLFREIRNELSAVFTHSIPVFSSILRTETPGEKGFKDFKLKINTCYKAIIRTANTINILSSNLTEEDEFGIRGMTLNSIDIFLASIYKELEKIFTITYKDLTDKNGIIISKVIGGRYNFSARNIIIPGNRSSILQPDEVEIGYVTFMELYRYEIQNLYRKIYHVTPNQANQAWKKAINYFDPKHYALIERMLKDPENKGRFGVIVNRNPSINYGSFIYCNIVRVKQSYSDKTMTLSHSVLTPMNADFDGDVLNVFRVIGEDLQKRIAKNLNPKYNLFVSRMDGKVNKEVMPIKDCIVAFWAFNNI